MTSSSTPPRECHRGIVESGAALRSAERAAATDQARQLIKALGGPDMAALRQIPAGAIIAAAKGMGPVGGRWGPVMDGAVLKGHPFDPVANPVGRDVPVMVGGDRLGTGTVGSSNGHAAIRLNSITRETGEMQ